MTNNYKNYTEISIGALNFNTKSQELIDKKYEILTSISQHYNQQPTSILFFGFSPLILGVKHQKIFVTEINTQTRQFLDERGVKYLYIDETGLASYAKKFDWVVAVEEYFTFFNAEEDQKTKIELLSSLAKSLLITTLRDYKNQEFKDREFSIPLSIHNKENRLYLEYHDYNFVDKNSWNTTVYEAQGTQSLVYGPFARRSMFFKQLAKFSIDAGAKQFYVHKNLMYKSLIKKNYEHVISISF